MVLRAAVGGLRAQGREGLAWRPIRSFAPFLRPRVPRATPWGMVVAACMFPSIGSAQFDPIRNNPSTASQIARAASSCAASVVAFTVPGSTHVNWSSNASSAASPCTRRPSESCRSAPEDGSVAVLALSAAISAWSRAIFDLGTRTEPPVMSRFVGLTGRRPRFVRRLPVAAS